MHFLNNHRGRIKLTSSPSSIYPLRPAVLAINHHRKVSDRNNVLLYTLIAFLLNWTAAQFSWFFLVIHVDCNHGLYMFSSIVVLQRNTKWSLAITGTPRRSETCSVVFFNILLVLCWFQMAFLRIHWRLSTILKISKKCMK